MEYFYAHNPFLTLRKLNSLQIQLKAELNLNDWIERRFCSASTLIVLLRTAVEGRPVGGQDLRLVIVNAACYIGACICRGRLPVLPIISPERNSFSTWLAHIFFTAAELIFPLEHLSAISGCIALITLCSSKNWASLLREGTDGRTDELAIVDLHRAPGDDKLLFCSS